MREIATTGAKALVDFGGTYAALKGRSSTVMHDFVTFAVLLSRDVKTCFCHPEPSGGETEDGERSAVVRHS